MRTVPVNQSAGPLPDGCEPFLLISIWNSFYRVNDVVACARRITGRGAVAPTTFKNLRRGQSIERSLSDSCGKAVHSSLCFFGRQPRERVQHKRSNTTK